MPEKETRSRLTVPDKPSLVSRYTLREREDTDGRRRQRQGTSMRDRRNRILSVMVDLQTSSEWLFCQHYYEIVSSSISLPDRKRDVSYLTRIPGAGERLQIFDADLGKPESFGVAIEGCIGVFHVAHPMDFDRKESEEENTKKSVNGTIGLLQACLDSKTVKRVVYTSSTSTVHLDDKGPDIADESKWSDMAYIRSSIEFGSVYAITKMLTEKACLEFAEKHGLDLVSVIPPWIHGPFLLPHIPASVGRALAMLFGDLDPYKHPLTIPFVHVDDVVRAHIFLFEYPEAKGRYNCSALEITGEKLAEFLSARYPEYHIPSPDSFKGITRVKYPVVSSKKLLDTGFEFKYGLEEMYDEAIQCCKQKGLL